MQPKKLAFTDEESQKLGEYLDKFVAAGPLYTLDDETFRSVQVLIARKIWEIRPDIARAIQEVANPQEAPALLIENVPIDEPLPHTPHSLHVSSTSSHSLRSHYFNAGVGLIRYGDIVPLSSMVMLNVINEPMTVRQGSVAGRRMHRDIFPDASGEYTKSGDIALHVQRENQAAATPLISINDIPPDLQERLKQAHFISSDGKNDPVLQEREGGLRFHPRFASDKDLKNFDNREVALELYNYMNQAALTEPLILKNKDFLLIDQSRVFHGVTDHDVIYPLEKDRWLIHTRFEVLNGHYKPISQGIYPLPDDINEAEILQRIAQSKNRPGNPNPQPVAIR